MVVDWLARLERRLATGEEDELSLALVSLAFAAGAEIPIPDGERRGTARRALLLLAAGGDPARGLDLEGRAVRAVADDLGTDERRALLAYGLSTLGERARTLPHVHEVLRALHDDPDLAWRAFAAAVLAEELEAD